MNNLLARADAISLLGEVAAREPAGVDLCYVDPPFNTGAAFAARTGPGEARGRRTHRDAAVAYEDHWGGIDGFLAFLAPRLVAIRDALTHHGTLWLHLDHRAVHEAKVLCDHVFGVGAFRGEVIWVPGNGARSRGGPSVTHQTILIYTRHAKRRPDMVWNDDHPSLREPYAETSLRMHFRSVDERGRRFRERVIGGKAYRYYADEGRRLGSVWSDLPAMVANTPIRSEGTGYPTQKPEKLLERIVRLTTRPNALVCDPMCGSGTTLVVAGKLGRRFCGGDINELAVRITGDRLRKSGLEFDTTLLEQKETGT